MFEKFLCFCGEVLESIACNYPRLYGFPLAAPKNTHTQMHPEDGGGN